jgi:hypothetical protein
LPIGLEAERFERPADFRAVMKWIVALKARTRDVPDRMRFAQEAKMNQIVSAPRGHLS